MFSESYDFRKPEDVLRVVQSQDRRLKLLLSIVYVHNDIFVKAGSALAKSKFHSRKAASYHSTSEHAAYHQGATLEYKILYEKLRAERDVITQVIAQTVKYYGLTTKRYGSSRIIGFKRRKCRTSKARPNGSVVNLSQKALFVFSKMWDQEGRPNLVNEHMLGGTDVPA